MPQTRSSSRALSSSSNPSSISGIADTVEFKKAIGQFQFSSSSNLKTQTSKPTAISDAQTSSARSSIRKTRPGKTNRQTSSYAPPSKYSHLKGLQDVIAPNLIVLFVGHNPGVRTATAGHAYAHPSNHFWKLLHASGLTDRRCRPEEDGDMPDLYSMGLTNIVARPTKDTAELSKEEQAAGTPILEHKIRQYRPEAICIVGKSIWEAIWRHRHGKNPTKSEFKYGWQDEHHNLGVVDEASEEYGEPWPGAKVFVATTTSGLAAALKPAEKEAIWKPIGDWAKQRREERKLETAATTAAAES
jgi:mismatch-specific thymine-DNA glycosylase